MKNSNDTIWNRTSDLPICGTAPKTLCHRGPHFFTVNDEEAVIYMLICQVSHHDDLNPSETAYVSCYGHWHWVESVGEIVAQEVGSGGGGV